jgi:hypothetical protein
MDAVQKARCAETDDIACIFRHIKADTYVTLRCKVINLIGFDIINDMRQLARIGKIAVMKKQSRASDMRVGIDVVYPARVEGARTPNKAMDFIPFGEQEFGKV